MRGVRICGGESLVVFAAAVACAWAAGTARAETAVIDVGRAAFEFPSEQHWEVRGLPDFQEGVNGGVAGRLDVSKSVLWLASGTGSVDAVMVVTGSRYSYADRLQWGESCEGMQSSSAIYVRNQWRNLWTEWHDDCLVAAGPLDVGSLLSQTNPEAAEAMGSAAARFRGPGYLVRARVARNGTFLAVQLLARQAFTGSKRALTVDRGVARVPPGVVQWGVELSSAMQSSILSLSGRVATPRIDLAPERDETPAARGVARDDGRDPWYRPVPMVPFGTPAGTYRLTIEFQVGAEGNVTQLRLAEASGNAAVDAACLGAVESYRFTPAKGDGVPSRTIRIPLEMNVQ